MNASLPTQKSKDSHGNHFLRKLKFPGWINLESD
jgi:hypothetical protein